MSSVSPNTVHNKTNTAQQQHRQRFQSIQIRSQSCSSSVLLFRYLSCPDHPSLIRITGNYSCDTESFLKCPIPNFINLSVPDESELRVCSVSGVSQVCPGGSQLSFWLTVLVVNDCHRRWRNRCWLTDCPPSTCLWFRSGVTQLNRGIVWWGTVGVIRGVIWSYGWVGMMMRENR